MSEKFNKEQYPWLSDFTLKVKDVFMFLHNEILDFCKFISSTPKDKEIRRRVVKRIKGIVN